MSGIPDIGIFSAPSRSVGRPSRFKTHGSARDPERMVIELTARD